MLELLRNKKIKVRAAARNPDEARQLVKTATEYGILPADAAKRITVVPVDLEDADSIAPALGNAGKVGQNFLCSIVCVRFVCKDCMRQSSE